MNETSKVLLDFLLGTKKVVPRNTAMLGCHGYLSHFGWFNLFGSVF